MPALGLTRCLHNKNSLGIFECKWDKDQHLLIFQDFQPRASGFLAQHCTFWRRLRDNDVMGFLSTDKPPQLVLQRATLLLLVVVLCSLVGLFFFLTNSFTLHRNLVLKRLCRRLLSRNAGYSLLEH